MPVAALGAVANRLCRHVSYSHPHQPHRAVSEIRRATGGFEWRIQSEQVIDYRPRRWWRGGDCRRCVGRLSSDGYRRSAEVLNVEQLTRTVRTSPDLLRRDRDQSGAHERSETPDRGRPGRRGGRSGRQPDRRRHGPDGGDELGAAAGGYAGSKIQKHAQDGNTTQSVEQRCRTTYDSAQQADGYQVRYRLGDREGTVRMDHDPGRRIPAVSATASWC